MPLTGDLPTTLFPKPIVAPSPLTFSKPVIHTRPVNSQDDYGLYTGLVINARGLGVKPCLNPKIYMEDGRVAYGVEWVDRESFEEKGIVGYSSPQNDFDRNPRVTHKPLIIKAIGVKGGSQTDLVIDTADAQTLHLVPEHLEFLKRGRVLVVLD